MSWVDFAGYTASGLVFTTFYMKDMIPLRVVALFSNVAFLIYAGGLHLPPIVLLHGALIPINVCRLVTALRAAGRQKFPDVVASLMGRSLLRPPREKDAS